VLALLGVLEDFMANGTYFFSSNHSHPLPRPTEPELRAEVKCPGCPENVEATPETFATYFREGAVVCHACQKPFDWWRATRDQIQRDIPWLGVLPAIGGRVMFSRQFVIPSGGTVCIDLDQLGVPSTAEVLHAEVELATQSSDVVRPALSQGNELHLDPFPRRIFLHGIPPLQPQPHPTYGSIWVCFVDLAQAPVAIHQLADAARQFIATRYEAMVVPANTAVELEMRTAVEQGTQGFGLTASDDSEFMRVGHAARMGTVVPMLCTLHALRPLDREIREGLKQLNTQRNRVGHSGQLSTPLDRQSAGTFLAAAAFGFQFARYLLGEIQSAKADRRLP
jgi:hypothetical protein